MSIKNSIAIGVVLTAVIAVVSCQQQSSSDGASQDAPIELLNVSYDPTRELWKAIDTQFIPKYEKESGRKLVIHPSNGGSSSQARAVVDGLDADVVTLALWSDTDVLRKKGLIRQNWDEQFPTNPSRISQRSSSSFARGIPRESRTGPI